jgi:hypothetical protein
MRLETLSEVGSSGLLLAWGGGVRGWGEGGGRC